MRKKYKIFEISEGSFTDHWYGDHVTMNTISTWDEEYDSEQAAIDALDLALTLAEKTDPICKKEFTIISIYNHG